MDADTLQFIADVTHADPENGPDLLERLAAAGTLAAAAREHAAADEAAADIDPDAEPGEGGDDADPD